MVDDPTTEAYSHLLGCIAGYMVGLREHLNTDEPVLDEGLGQQLIHGAAYMSKSLGTQAPAEVYHALVANLIVHFMESMGLISFADHECNMSKSPNRELFRKHVDDFIDHAQRGLN